MTFTSALLLFVTLSLTLTLVVRALRRLDTHAPPAPPPKRPGRRPLTPSSLPRATLPDLVMLKWDEAADAKVARATPSPESLRAKLRDRYIAARFPGAFNNSAQLREPEYVIKIARLYFEEQKTDRAQELLDMAIEQAPAEWSLRLAQLEIAFLMRDPKLFTRLARAFREIHPDRSEWSDVARLGHAIAPGEALFDASPGVRAHEHYGPWPDMPNWIQASWDLTTDVLAADFHRVMAGQVDKSRRRPLRRVA